MALNWDSAEKQAKKLQEDLKPYARKNAQDGGRMLPVGAGSRDMSGPAVTPAPAAYRGLPVPPSVVLGQSPAKRIGDALAEINAYEAGQRGRMALPMPTGRTAAETERDESRLRRKAEVVGPNAVAEQEAVRRNRQGLFNMLASEQEALGTRTEAEGELFKLRQQENMRWRSRDPRDPELSGQLKTAEQAAEEARRGVGQVNYVKEHMGRSYDDHFLGQSMASYEMGRLNQDAALAWSRYLSEPTEANRTYAQAVGALMADTAVRNEKTLDADATLPWLSQSFAGYLPQFFDQTAAGLKGGLSGATLGTMAAGPAGTVTGAKIGYAAGRANQGFEVMQGAAFKQLLDAGVPEEIARKAAKDEGFISSLIEAADAGVDLLTLGGGKLLTMLGKGGAKAAAAAAGETALKKAAKILAGYGINILGEGAQEYVQEGVSIANQRRAMEGRTGQLDLAGETLGLMGNVLTGRDQASADQMTGAGIEGMKIAALAGGAQLAGNTLASHMLTTGREAAANTSIDRAYGAMLEHGPFSQEAGAAMERADRALGPRMLPTGAEANSQTIQNLREEQKNPASIGETGYNRIEVDAIRHEGKTFRNLVAGIDSSVSAFFDKWKSGRKNQQGEKLEKLYLGKMSDAVKQQVSSILGYSVDGRDFIITNDDVKHIMDEHGDSDAEVRKGNLPLDTWALDSLQDVVSNPDSVTPGHIGEGKKNAGKLGAVFAKSFPDGRVVCIQFDNKGRGTMEITTMYVKKGNTISEMDADQAAPIRTSKTPESVLPSAPSIAHVLPGGNSQYMQSRMEDTGGYVGIKKKNRQDTIPNADVSIGPVDNARSAPPQGPSFVPSIAHGLPGGNSQYMRNETKNAPGGSVETHGLPESKYLESLYRSEPPAKLEGDGDYWDGFFREEPPEQVRTDIPEYLNEGVENTQQRAEGRIKAAKAALDNWASNTFGPKTAEVRSELKTGTGETFRERITREGRTIYRKMVDSGEAVARMGKDLGDRSLYAYYNFARASANVAGNMIAKGGAQTDLKGQAIGKSLSDLFEPIRAKGDDYYKAFEAYLFHRHNVDRMSRNNQFEIDLAKEALDAFDERDPDIARMPESDLAHKAALGDYAARERLELLNTYNRAKDIHNKPVFGYDVSAMDSITAADELAHAHPEFVDLAEEVYRYNRNMMQYRVDSGLLTREQADRIERTYPHYVPTYRVTEQEGARTLRKGKNVSSTLGHAQGGTSDLMPLHIAMARQTMQVVRNGAVNRFGTRLLEDHARNRAVGKKYIYEVEDAKYDGHPDTFDMLEDTEPQKDNTFTVFQEGKAVQMTVDKALYEGIGALTPGKNSALDASFWKAPAAATSVFKALVTGYNPMFSARNFARDLQEAGLYSRDPVAWAKSYPLAVKEITTGGNWWKRYQALGGVYSSVFDYQQGYKLNETEHGAVRRQTLDRIEGVNMAIEQATRLAEFMAQVKKNGDNSDSVMDAMLAAADVTTNFGRSGEIGKFLNRTFVPFLNPSIQGLDKMARTFLGKKEGSEWIKLLARVAVLGIVPAVVNELVNVDEPEWDNVRQSDKDVNWLLSLGDGRYLKIPKGRDMSVAVMVANRVGALAKGEDVDWGSTLRTAANQIAPPNPLENNIMAAWVDADLLDRESPGRTWYGGDIESQRLQNYAPGQRYDEGTDIFSKWLGGALNLSPKKINYLLDQYSGVVGDFVLPLMSPKGNKNPLAPVQNAFVLDSVSSNRLNGDFYDTADRITYAKNGGDAAMGLVERFWNKQARAVSDVYAQIREIENDGTLTNTEKQEQVRAAKAIINGIEKNALGVLSDYEAAVRQHYTGSDEKEQEKAYREANREVFGAEYALQVYNKDVYAKALTLNGRGLSYEDFYDAYFAVKEAAGTGKGSTQRQREALVAIDGLTASQKAALGVEILGDSRRLDYSSATALNISLLPEGVRKKAAQAEETGIRPEDFLAAYEAQVGVTGETGTLGKTIKYSEDRKKKEKIDAVTQGLTVQQRRTLYELLGISQAVWGLLPTGK